MATDDEHWDGREEFEAAVMHMTSPDTLTVMVLKGHLLVEQQIERHVAAALKHPSKLH